ncbi:hypothetical protein Ahy_B04g070134 isoform D [Arachis hypogaea]|uniref:UBC core domain-containing protein n=1 Tax=Arachis hypogaea TaxID=3818 RepID=A0A444ZF25_ARAHY|nr:hypothetical protein Ahy_B04g070134 isoform D [Arachis hypogaea]
MAEKYNMKNPAVKRILQEVKEMQSNPSDDFTSLPLEPNGRFETQTKICLSISNHHPEHWQPSWSVRTALVALIAFMPTNPNGALGSLDYKKEERRTLAIKSREAPPKFGTPERQKLIDEIHEYMLSKAPPVPQHSSIQLLEEEHSRDEEAESQANSHNPEALPAEEGIPDQAGDRIVEEEVVVDDNPQGVEPSTEIQSSVSRNQSPHNSGLRVQNLKPETRIQQKLDDHIFTLIAIGLAIAIVALLLKKFVKSSDHGPVFMDGS